MFLGIGCVANQRMRLLKINKEFKELRANCVTLNIKYARAAEILLILIKRIRF